MFIPTRRRWFQGIPGLVLAFSVSSALGGEPIRANDGGFALSRVTIELPVLTRHFPDNSSFNNHNWGAIVDVAITDQWSVVGAYFRNSYDRDTLLAGIGWYPIRFERSSLKVELGGIAALDLNGGYKSYNQANPLLGALSIKIGNARARDYDANAVSRLGLAITVIPAVSGSGSTGVNLAVTYRL